MRILLELFLTFSYISLISFGGIRTSFPELERLVVQVHNWMSHDTLVNLYALGVLVPGPNVFYSFLIGDSVAGLWGAIVSLLGIVAPPCLLIVGVSYLIEKPENKIWMRRFYTAMSPITIGLTSATIWTIGQSFDAFNIAIAVIATLLSLFTSISPALVVFLAVLLGIVQSLSFIY